MQSINLETSHPSLPNTTRKATIIETNVNHRDKFSYMVIIIDNYDSNGDIINNSVVRSYQVVLRADNTTFVDMATGDLVPEGSPNSIGEYDYIYFLEGQVLPYSNQDFKTNVVLRAEQQGRFDR